MGLGMQVSKKEGVGIIISAARPGGAVASAEPYLRVGDRIISINSKPVKTVADVTNHVKGESGFEVQLHCSRVSQGKGRFVSLISLFRDMPGHHKVRLYAKAKNRGEGGSGEVGGEESADEMEKQTLFASSKHVPKPSTYVEKSKKAGGGQVAAAVGSCHVADEKQTAAIVAAVVAAAQAHATEKETKEKNSTGEGERVGAGAGAERVGGEGTDVRPSPPSAKSTGSGLKCRRRLAPSSVAFTAGSTSSSPSNSVPLAEAVLSNSATNKGSTNVASTSVPLAEAVSSNSATNQGSTNISICASKAGPTSRGSTSEAITVSTSVIAGLGSTSEAITVSTNVIPGLQISDSSDTSPRSPTTSAAKAAATSVQKLPVSAVVTNSSPNLTRPIDAASPSLTIPFDLSGAEHGRAVPTVDEGTGGGDIKSTHSEDSVCDALPFGELDLMWPPMGTGSCKTVYQAYWNGNCVAAAKLREGDGRSELALLRLLRDKLPAHPHIPVSLDALNRKP